MHEQLIVLVKAKDIDDAESVAYSWLEKHEKDIFAGTTTDYWSVTDVQKFCEEYAAQLVEEDLDGVPVLITDRGVESDLDEALDVTKGEAYWAVLVDYHC